MLKNDFLAYGEAEPGSFGLCREVGIKDRRVVLRKHARTVVLDPDTQLGLLFVARPRGRYGDAWRLHICIFQGLGRVAYQVVHDPLHHDSIDVDLNYLGRSEDSGFLSQQVIITEGGFKSIFEDSYANQWILSSNASIGLWRWVELYADAGFLKSRNEDARFKYDTGIRLNFIHNFLEVYFPLQSSNGFEPEFSDYASRIRFVITIDIERVYNFIKRGFY